MAATKQSERAGAERRARSCGCRTLLSVCGLRCAASPSPALQGTLRAPWPGSTPLSCSRRLPFAGGHQPRPSEPSFDVLLSLPDWHAQHRAAACAAQAACTTQLPATRLPAVWAGTPSDPSQLLPTTPVLSTFLNTPTLRVSPSCPAALCYYISAVPASSHQVSDHKCSAGR